MSNPSTYATGKPSANGAAPKWKGGAGKPWDADTQQELLASLREQIGSGARKVAVPIAFAVEHLTQKLTEIPVRRPTARDLFESRFGEIGDNESQLALLTRLTELPPDVLLSLDLADYRMLGRVLAGFS